MILRSLVRILALNKRWIILPNNIFELLLVKTDLCSIDTGSLGTRCVLPISWLSWLRIPLSPLGIDKSKLGPDRPKTINKMGHSQNTNRGGFIY